MQEDDVKLEQVSKPGYMVQFGRFLSVNAVSSMAYLLTQFQGFGRDGRRRILRELTAYDLIFFLFAKAKILGWQLSQRY